VELADSLEVLGDDFLMMPGEIERDQDHDEKESVTENASDNSSPSLTHSRLFLLRQEALLF
jgi:hypothetical protein